MSKLVDGAPVFRLRIFGRRPTEYNSRCMKALIALWRPACALSAAEWTSLKAFHTRPPSATAALLQALDIPASSAGPPIPRSQVWESMQEAAQNRRRVRVEVNAIKYLLNRDAVLADRPSRRIETAPGEQIQSKGAGHHASHRTPARDGAVVYDWCYPS